MSQSQAIAIQPDQYAGKVQAAILKGNLIELSPAERYFYYNRVCSLLGLNPEFQPFDLLKTKDEEGKDKLILYANASCAAMLSATRGVSVVNVEHQYDSTGEYLTVRAFGRMPDGRLGTNVGVICLKGLVGQARANAIMKAETKAQRRLILRMCGLGFLDETEVETIPGAQRIAITGDDDITVTAREAGLDQWKCSRKRAMEIIGLCEKIKAKDKEIGDEDLRAKLPVGVNSRKDLSELQAADFIQTLQTWLDQLTNTVQGEVVHG
jgi:hypothetical protein